MTKQSHSILRWTTRVLAALILLLGLPFYFGYGNPLPFVKPDYTLWDNTWLSVFPLMFIGLALGWKYERAGGLLITLSISTGFIIGYITEKDITVHMFVPFIIGLLYLLLSFTKKRNTV
jgi:hypothetical protein